MIVEEIFENTIYPELKKNVEENSIYSPLVTKRMPQQSDKFPIVPIKLLSVKNFYNNLSYGEETYSFGINIDVYSTDKNINNKIVSKRTICDEVTNKIIEYIKLNYHVTINVEYDAINADENIHRNNIKITGILDTKYGLNNIVIYPR